VPEGGNIGSVVREHVGSREQLHGHGDFGSVNLKSWVLHALGAGWCRRGGISPLHELGDGPGKRHVA